MPPRVRMSSIESSSPGTVVDGVALVVGVVMVVCFLVLVDCGASGGSGMMSRRRYPRPPVRITTDGKECASRTMIL